MTETFIVILIVAFSIIFVGRKLYKTLLGKTKCSCGCSGCSVKTEKKFLAAKHTK